MGRYWLLIAGSQSCNDPVAASSPDALPGSEKFRLRPPESLEFHKESLGKRPLTP